MWLLRTVFTHWTGSSGSEHVLHVHTRPWSAPFISCLLFTSDCRVNGGQMCLCILYRAIFTQVCAATTTQQGSSPWTCQQTNFAETGVHTYLIWETFLMVYQYLHTGWWIKWGRVDIVMRSDLHTLNQSNKIKQGQKVDPFWPIFLPHVTNCFMKGTNSVSSVDSCPGVLWTVCSLTTLASGYCGIWIKSRASVPSTILALSHSINLLALMMLSP